MPKTGHNQYTQKENAFSQREEKAQSEPTVEKPKPKLEVAAEISATKLIAQNLQVPTFEERKYCRRLDDMNQHFSATCPNVDKS